VFWLAVYVRYAIHCKVDYKKGTYNSPSWWRRGQFHCTSFRPLLIILLPPWSSSLPILGKTRCVTCVWGKYNRPLELMVLVNLEPWCSDVSIALLSSRISSRSSEWFPGMTPDLMGNCLPKHYLVGMGGLSWFPKCDSERLQFLLCKSYQKKTTERWGMNRDKPLKLPRKLACKQLRTAGAVKVHILLCLKKMEGEARAGVVTGALAGSQSLERVTHDFLKSSSPSRLNTMQDGRAPR
jgi:hypothetical protein